MAERIASRLDQMRRSLSGRASGAFHVISLAAPYLEPRERELVDQLAKRYVACEDAMAAGSWKPFPYDADAYR